MMLDTITLPDGLRWIEAAQDHGATATVRRRLDGGMAVYPRAVVGGRSITLEADPDYWLTQTTATALVTLAAIPGAVYTLTMGVTAYQVMFRHQDPPAVDLRAMIDYDSPAANDPYVGQIKLMTV